MGNIAASKHLAYYKRSWIVVKRIMMRIDPVRLGKDLGFCVTILGMDDTDLHRIRWHVKTCFDRIPKEALRKLMSIRSGRRRGWNVSV